MAEQNFSNHAKIVPPYHFGISIVLLINLGFAAWSLFKGFSFATVMQLLLAFVFLGFFWYMRIFAITVQNRVIRLEMRLRLKEILPDDLRGRIHDLTTTQLIALRFASDEEMPELVKAVLDGELQGGKAIKQRIKNWQADHLRC